MKERPILMNTDMTRATLEGRKGMTRRTRGLDEINKDPDAWLVNTYMRDGNFYAHFRSKDGSQERLIKCPYGVPGDRLWVRETWAPVGDMNRREHLSFHVRYKADEIKAVGAYGCQKWRPSIFMPRWACRLYLDITDVRAERVQEITIADSVAEGVPCQELGITDDELCRGQFADLWDAINEKRGLGWKVNPWNWPITFKRVEI